MLSLPHNIRPKGRGLLFSCYALRNVSRASEAREAERPTAKEIAMDYERLFKTVFGLLLASVPVYLAAHLIMTSGV